jgi:hypothetical protein
MANRIHDGLVWVDNRLEELRNKNRPLYHLIYIPSIAVPIFIITALAEKFIEEQSWGTIMRALLYLGGAFLLCLPIIILSFFEFRAAKKKSIQVLWSGWIVALCLAIALAWSMLSPSHSKSTKNSPETLQAMIIPRTESAPAPSTNTESTIETAVQPQIEIFQSDDTNSRAFQMAQNEELMRKKSQEQAEQATKQHAADNIKSQTNWVNYFPYYHEALVMLHDELEKTAPSGDNIAQYSDYFDCLPKTLDANDMNKEFRLTDIWMQKHTNIIFTVTLSAANSWWHRHLTIAGPDSSLEMEGEYGDKFYCHVDCDAINFHDPQEQPYGDAAYQMIKTGIQELVTSEYDAQKRTKK